MNQKLKPLPPLQKDDFKPLYAQLTEAIGQYIKLNNLGPGAPLPSETDIMNHYGVSRVTARQALQRLATEGLVKKVQGKGTFVAEPRITGILFKWARLMATSRP